MRLELRQHELQVAPDYPRPDDADQGDQDAAAEVLAQAVDGACDFGAAAWRRAQLVLPEAAWREHVGVDQGSANQPRLRTLTTRALPAATSFADAFGHV